MWCGKEPPVTLIFFPNLWMGLLLKSRGFRIAFFNRMVDKDLISLSQTLVNLLLFSKLCSIFVGVSLFARRFSLHWCSPRNSWVLKTIPSSFYLYGDQGLSLPMELVFMFGWNLFFFFGDDRIVFAQTL